MADASFDPYWPLLLDVEGRTLDLDPHDPGNWTGGKIGAGKLVGTKFGIDAASHSAEADIPNLTEDQAKAIYKRSYAAPVHFDELQPGVDVSTLDPAINSGVEQGLKFLQRAVGAPADGGWGPKTKAAARAADALTTIKAIAAQRLGFYQGLTSMFARYGKGWTARVAKIEAFATGLALAASGVSPQATNDHLRDEAATAASDAQSARTSAGTVGTGGAVVSGASTQAPADSAAHLPSGSVLVVMIIVTVIGVAYFVWKNHTQKLRATAFAAAALGG